MKDYATFSPMSTAVNLEYVGVLNGYKINSVLHNGREVSLTKNSYFYIPKTRQVVSYRGTKAKAMVVSSDGKFNFQEKLPVRGVVPFKVDADDVRFAAERIFG